MDSRIRDLVREIHGVGRPMALVLTGGGVTAASWLLAVPGGSRTVLEVVVPYAQSAFDAWLGNAPASGYCDSQTAVSLARRAEERARWLASGTEVLGVACTASLRSDRPKKGEHRVHVAVTGGGKTYTLDWVLAKEKRSREEEEDVTSRLVLGTVARALGLESTVDPEPLEGDQPGQDILSGQAEVMCYRIDPDGRHQRNAILPKLLVPGSFNPLHVGHLELARVAGERSGLEPAFELSVINADKPALPEAEIRRRAHQFAYRAPLWITRAPTFVEKARLFPGAVFVVGADTAARIVMERFYQNSSEKMRTALEEIRSLGCQFLVAGRVKNGGRFVGLEDLHLPEEFVDLFRGIPESAFRVDLSSTELRAESR